MFQMIQSSDVKFPTQIEMSDDCCDIILRLLDKDPGSRFGTKGDEEEIRKHSWFKDIDWKELERKKLKAPYIPDNKEATNFEFFDKEFT